MQFGKQQQQAIKKVRAWLEDPEAPQVFRLFGWAGSGKTTLAKYLEEMAKEIFKTATPTIYAAYTGKAALVLQQKGCTDAQTLHSLIYKPQIDESTGHVIGYSLFGNSPVRKVKYVTLDEVSMVNEEMGRDLESFGTKLLVLGDPFQLPPISKGENTEGYFTNPDDEPDVMLTEIHRQALDNPIIYMSTEIREGRDLSYGRYGESRVLRPKKLTDDFYVDHEQILCGMNKTRTNTNMHIRALDGHTGPLPVKGDKLICIKNDKDLGVLNGGMWKVTKFRPGNDKHFQVYLKSLDRLQPNGEVQRIIADVNVEQFKGDRTIDPKKLKGYVQLDFGNCITVHKAQGSQWDSVGIINEDFIFGAESARWLYTGLSRAAERVTLVGR